MNEERADRFNGTMEVETPEKAALRVAEPITYAYGVFKTALHPDTGERITVPKIIVRGTSGNTEENQAVLRQMIWQRARQFVGRTPEATGEWGETTHADGWPEHPEFLIKNAWRKNRIAQSARLGVYYHEVNRPSKRQPLKGIAVCVEGTGRYDKKCLYVVTGSDRITVAAKQEAVKGAIRRLRPEEAAEIGQIDARIAATRAELLRLGEEREATLKRAFAKGHTVYLNEVKRIADAKLAAIKIRESLRTEGK